MLKSGREGACLESCEVFGGVEGPTCLVLVAAALILLIQRGGATRGGGFRGVAPRGFSLRCSQLARPLDPGASIIARSVVVRQRLLAAQRLGKLAPLARPG